MANEEKVVLNIELPKYTLKEEIWNSISHGIGAVFAIIVFIICIYYCVINKDLYPTVNLNYGTVLASLIIYGISIICLYTNSCLYHALARNNGKRVFRVIDHDMVFLLIGGTYTPFCLGTLYQTYNGPLDLGIFMTCVVWGLVALGITLNSINIKKFNVICTFLYIAIGWCIIFVIVPFYNNITLHTYGFLAFICLFIGGILYTLGSILYGIGSKKKGMHTVFHFYVLAASVFQFLAVLFGVVLI